jgi:hypothetical protein
VPYYALFYDFVDDFLERRPAYRPQHLALVDAAHANGTLHLAGALKPADSALLVFRADDAGQVEQFVERDPYVVNGLVKSWRVREWGVVVGEHAIPRS